jgi:polyferredoxin
MIATKADKRALRSFGLIVAAGFGIIALWPALARGEGPRMWALLIAVVMSSTALIYAPVLKPVFRLWMFMGEILGWINTRLILGLLFYGLIMPIGIMLRIAHKDPMQRHFDRDAASYRIPRTKRPASHMLRQY